MYSTCLLELTLLPQFPAGAVTGTPGAFRSCHLYPSCLQELTLLPLVPAGAFTGTPAVCRSWHCYPRCLQELTLLSQSRLQKLSLVPKLPTGAVTGTPQLSANLCTLAGIRPNQRKRNKRRIEKGNIYIFFFEDQQLCIKLC